MKRKFFKFAIALLGLTLVVGCNNDSSSSSAVERDALTETEFALAYDRIVKSVPLVVDKTSGDNIHSNAYRNELGTPVPDLVDGNDLVLIKKGIINYQDDNAGIYFIANYEIDWSYQEGETLGTFVFLDGEDDTLMTAEPGYPTYKPEYDGGGKPTHTVPNAKTARLIATIKIDSYARKANFDMYLHAIELIEWYRISQVRNLPEKTLVGVRGYVTGIFPDWNNATINDGKWGFGLFKVQDYEGLMKVGDLVEVVGQFTVYNCLAQVQFVKRIKVVEDTSLFPEINEPDWTTFTIDELADQLDRTPSDLFGALQDYDGALIKFNEPFTYVKTVDRNGEEIALSALDTATNVHHDIIVRANTDEYDEREYVDVKVSINYHLGQAHRDDIKAFFVALGNDPFYYEGHLGAYNEFVLAPYNVDAFLLAPS